MSAIYLCNDVSAVNVLCEDGCGQSVVCVVSALDHLVHTREADYLLHRTEDLEYKGYCAVILFYGPKFY